MDRTGRAAALVAEVAAVLAEGIEAQLAGWEGADLCTIEAEAQQVLRRVGGALLGGLAALRVAAQAAQPPACPGCGGPLRLVAEARPRVLVGLVGEATVRRPYYHCAACRAGAAPLDAAWGLGAGALTPELARVACRDGIEGSFARAAELVREHLGVRLDAEAVRGISEAAGQLAEADQRDRERWAAPAEAAPAVLLLELDGVQVHERAAWRECKVARVAPLGPALVRDEETGEQQLALGPSGYAAGLEGADACWQRAMREAWRQGWGRGVRTAVVLGDGADWIWRQARCQLGRPGVEVVEIVDFYHAAEHLAAVAGAAFGAGSLRAHDWLDRQRHALRHRGAGPVRRALGRLRPPTAAAAEEVRRARGYFRTHAHRMRYPAFRARRFPIGSGAIESAAKNLIQQRQVQAGMRWGAAGAQRVASLRALHRSGRWAAFWQGRPLRRLRLLRPRPRAAPPPAAALPSTGAAAAACPPPASLPPPADAPSPAPRPRRPWEKGADYWRRTPAVHRRSA